MCHGHGVWFMAIEICWQYHGNMGSYEIANMIIGLWAWTYNGMNALWQYLSNNNRHILGYIKSPL